MYPAFLRWAVPRRSKIVEAEPTHAFWSRRFALLSLGVILLGAVLGLGLSKVNTDPSLMDYFKPNQPLRDGLEFVDRTGGSNPLTLVVSARDGSRLNTDEAYQKMWRLHGVLENEKDVGTVISLPTLLAEGDRMPFSFLISYKKMMEIIATGFAVFVLSDFPPHAAFRSRSPRWMHHRHPGKPFRSTPSRRRAVERESSWHCATHFMRSVMSSRAF